MGQNGSTGRNGRRGLSKNIFYAEFKETWGEEGKISEFICVFFSGVPKGERNCGKFPAEEKKNVF